MTSALSDEQVAEWKAGGEYPTRISLFTGQPHPIPFKREDGTIPLRVNGERVQTGLTYTRDVEWDGDAMRALYHDLVASRHLWPEVALDELEWEGYPAQEYDFDYEVWCGIVNDVALVKLGCHLLRWEELEEIARQLGFDKEVVEITV